MIKLLSPLTANMPVDCCTRVDGMRMEIIFAEMDGDRMNVL